MLARLQAATRAAHVLHARALTAHTAASAAARPAAWIAARTAASAADGDVDVARSKQLKAASARIGGLSDALDVLDQATTHVSFQHGKVPNNARLSFLGDRVLGLAVAQHIHATYPKLPAGLLSRATGTYVSNSFLSEVARGVGLNDLVRWHPPTDEASAHFGMPKVLATSLEAVIGALYEREGGAAAQAFVTEHVLTRTLDMWRLVREKHPEAVLRETLVAEGKAAPAFRVLHEVGESTRRWVAQVESDGQLLGEGVGESKKAAREDAAQKALAATYGEVSDAAVPTIFDAPQ